MQQYLKMGETTAVSNSALQVSVSFGRFENESLSWEKWSSFSPNKYLEEVEKCATPGSVAEKKAYFEAHYKKIAARKAELLAEEKQAKEECFRSEEPNSLDLSGNSCGTDADFDISNTQDSIEGAKQETGSFGETEISKTEVDNLEEEVAISIYCRSSSVKGENREPECRSHSSEQTDKPEEAVCIKQEENLKVEAEYLKEISHVVYEEKEKSSQIQAKDVKLDHPKEHKVTFISNGAKTKKETLLPTSKTCQVSMPRSSKPTTTPTKTLASASSTKRGNFPSLSRRQATSSVESINVSNKSLHMSLSLGRSKPDLAPHTTMRKSFIMEKMRDKDIASNLDPAPHTTMRKSSIMEKMGDKDIVKRAFKTFQNNVHQPKTFGEDRSLVKKQVPSRGTVPKVSTSTALRKENGRATKVDGVDKRSRDSVRTTRGPKSDIRAEKGKESSRKIEDKSNAKEVERTRLQSKLKEEKEAETKKLKHNFKATPLPAFYGGQKVSKSHQEKGDAKNENHR